jgi:hypothetical protein
MCLPTTTMEQGKRSSYRNIASFSEYLDGGQNPDVLIFVLMEHIKRNVSSSEALGLTDFGSIKVQIFIRCY